MCYIGTGNDKKNLKAYRKYPTQVQELIKEKNEVKEPNLLYIFVCNTIFFSIIFFIISLVFKKILNFDSYLSCLIYFIIF